MPQHRSVPELICPRTDVSPPPRVSPHRCPRTVVSLNRYVPAPSPRTEDVLAPICPRTDRSRHQHVPASMCNASICPRIDVSQYQYVPAPICPRTDMSPHQCVPVPICPCTDTSQYRCSPAPMCPCPDVSPHRYVPVRGVHGQDVYGPKSHGPKSNLKPAFNIRTVFVNSVREQCSSIVFANSFVLNIYTNDCPRTAQKFCHDDWFPSWPAIDSDFKRRLQRLWCLPREAKGKQNKEKRRRNLA